MSESQPAIPSDFCAGSHLLVFSSFISWTSSLLCSAVLFFEKKKRSCGSSMAPQPSCKLQQAPQSSFSIMSLSGSLSYMNKVHLSSKAAHKLSVFLSQSHKDFLSTSVPLSPVLPLFALHSAAWVIFIAHPLFSLSFMFPPLKQTSPMPWGKINPHTPPPPLYLLRPLFPLPLAPSAPDR